MDLDTLIFLQSPEAQDALKRGKGTDPSRFALQLQGSSLPSAALATQLKYRERAATKLPTWEAAGCIFEAQAFEQCSSEQVAAIKPWGEGGDALDLSCGLGVDAVAMAQHYESVTAVESDRMRFMLARFNFQQLGLENLSVWHSDAESWLADCKSSRFDLIYIDPDRRDHAGGRHFRFADSSPNILEIQEQLLAMSQRVLIKASPMLDIDAALKELRNVHAVTVIAVDGECKELLFELHATLQGGWVPRIGVRFLRRAQLHIWEGAAKADGFVPSELPTPRFLHEADISLYKARMAAEWFADQYDGQGMMSHPEGYFFSSDRIPDFPSRAFEVLHTLPWKPELIRKHFKSLGIQQVNLTRRHFDIPLEQVRQQLRIAEGGTDYLVLTQVWRGGDPTAIGWQRVAFHARRADG